MILLILGYRINVLLMFLFEKDDDSVDIRLRT